LRILILICVGAIASFSVNADPVTRLIDHGPLPVDENGEIIDIDRVPTHYGIFQGSLFFSREGRLLRLDGANASPQALQHFAVFDGSLFINLALGFTYDDRADLTARRYEQSAVFRLDDRESLPVQIDMPITARPDPPYSGPPGYTAVGWPRRGRFAEYDGQLYFFGFEGYVRDGGLLPTFCNNDPFIDSLFRIASSSSSAIQVGTTYCEMAAVSGTPILGSDVGLLTVIIQPGSRGAPSSSEFLVLSENPDNSRSINTTIMGLGYPVEPDPLEAVVFDGYIFFRGLQTVGSNPGYPDIGPFPVLPDVGSDLFQVELYRYDPASGEKIYYDLYSVSTEQAREFNLNNINTRFGSSDPRFFAVANGVLYFQASRTDGFTFFGETRENSELYRMTSADALPELISLNPNESSAAAPLGEYLGRLWLLADTGTGVDLHYLAQDGVSAVPLGVGEVVAKSARGFIEYEDRLIFTAQGEDGRWATYAATINGRVPDKPDTPDGKKPKKPAPSPPSPKGKTLETTLTVDSRSERERPGFRAAAGSVVSVRCDVTNQSTRAIHSVKTSLGNQRATGSNKDRKTIRSCRSAVLEPGDTTICRRSIRLQKGKRKFQCISQARTQGGTRLRSRDAAFTHGR